MDEATAGVLFSDAAVMKPYETLVPLATPAPTSVPDWPGRDAEGFLAGDGEYCYENDEAGLWIWLSGDLQIVITAREDSSIPLEWYETDIRTRGSETFYSVMTDPERPGKKYQYPYVIARDARCVLAFSDDFFATRITEKQTVGVIIRDGKIIRTDTNRATGHHLPNLDMMAQYPDGRLEVYECNEYSAEELLSMRAAARSVPIAASVQEYALRLVLATHPETEDAPEAAKKYLRFGASPRAAQALLSAARVRALAKGRFNVAYDDIRVAAPACLRHRAALNFEAVTAGKDMEAVLAEILAAVSEK